MPDATLLGVTMTSQQFDYKSTVALTCTRCGHWCRVLSFGASSVEQEIDALTSALRD